MLLLKHKSWLASMDTSQLMQCIITEKQSNQINIDDEAKKMAHDSQLVRAKDFKLTHNGPSQRQESGTNQRIKPSS